MMKLLLILILMPLLSLAQSREEKTQVIIKKVGFIKSIKQRFGANINALKKEATGKDSLRLVALEKKLTDQLINTRVSKVLDENLNDKEIDDLYNYIKNKSFEKLSSVLYNEIDVELRDILDEIESLSEIFEPKQVPKKVTSKENKFEGITFDREDGFYLVLGNTSTAKDIKLAKKPAVTKKDIRNVKKVNNNELKIWITFNKKGAKKFYALTKENIGKPVAIVVGKRIVSMPIVYEAISRGEISISGKFSEQEVDQMIKILKEK